MEALAEVARALLEGGAAALPLGEAGVDWVSRDHDETLGRLDAAARVDAPGVPPPLDLPAARWGLGRLAHLAARVVDREESAEPVEVELVGARAIAMPDRMDATHVWSVDLCLRHLESIERQARGLRGDDPVVSEIRRLARDWPLSAVTLPALGSSALAAPDLPPCVREHATLRRLYLDRVTLSRSRAHAREPWVATAVRADHGRDLDWLPD